MKTYLKYFLKRIKVLEGRILLNKKRYPRTINNAFANLILFIGLLVMVGCVRDIKAQTQETKPHMKIGVYYFDGWAGHYVNGWGGQRDNASVPYEPWEMNAPRQLTRRMVEEFPEREPVWGWRDDSQAIMERQIDLAADNGIEFFLFCWYWRDNNGPINTAAIENLDLHTSINLYLKSKNKNRIKFGLLVANHQGSEIKGTENWEKATEYCTKYFKDPQYITVDGKPLVVIINSGGINEDGLARMQEVSKRLGLPGLSMAGCEYTANKSFNYRTRYSITPGYRSTRSEEHKYAELIDAHKKQWTGTEEQPYIPVATVGFDKRPWENKTGSEQSWYYNTDRTPEQFKSILTDANKWMDEHPTRTTKERIVLIYAWNELGEGGYLVPTKGDPEASYLKVIKSVVSGK